ncbi:kinetochore protein Sos7 [Parachaetomium inaequale]|uniref:Kinetochore protein Sos7 n=1 Tax=Parachaetomium inaequale TaxID=2588326 RepID=A0AAN6SRR9_9PEZI|nr:kinetochore protein Sos7 [Parachaetomium inaequale]
MSRSTSPAKPDRQRSAQVLRALEELQHADGSEYTIIKLSEPISSATPSVVNDPTTTPKTPQTTTLARTSDVSTTSLDNTGPTPTSLEADLAHYRELFAKLRFSYVEQVTKEKFIRAIVGDPPLIVSAQENADLEAANAAAKAELKALKEEVAEMVAGLEGRGRELVGRYERVKGEMAVLGGLPGRIAEVEKEVGGLREAQKVEAGLDGRPEMNMPLGKTLALVEGRRRELGGVERQVEVLGGQVPRKRKELERLRAEVAALENKRANSAAAAREAKRRRENAQGGVEDELEARGRWYRASETVLRQVLGLQG